VFDHIGLCISQLERSRRFYLEALGAIGYRLLAEYPVEVAGHRHVLGFGDERPRFWLSVDRAGSGTAHVAFTVDRRAQVDAFHAAGLAAGGRDNGAPGLRSHYHPDYYGAFLLDPDGHNLEAVCRGAGTDER